MAAVNYAKPKSPFSFLDEAVYPLGEGVIELGWPVRLAGVVHHRDASVLEVEEGELRPVRIFLEHLADVEPRHFV